LIVISSSEELGSDTDCAIDVERRDRKRSLARFLHRAGVGGFAGQRHRHGQAIGAERRAGCLAGDGNHTLALLAGALGHELLDPQTERL
jgi:hypothetical protein